MEPMDEAEREAFREVRARARDAGDRELSDAIDEALIMNDRFERLPHEMPNAEVAAFLAVMDEHLRYMLKVLRRFERRLRTRLIR
jgi:hypothetical protein